MLLLGPMLDLLAVEHKVLSTDAQLLTMRMRMLNNANSGQNYDCAERPGAAPRELASGDTGKACCRVQCGSAIQYSTQAEMLPSHLRAPKTACAHTRVCACVHVRVYACMTAYVRVHVHVQAQGQRVHAHAHTCVRGCTHTLVRASMRVFIERFCFSALLHLHARKRVCERVYKHVQALALAWSVLLFWLLPVFA